MVAVLGADAVRASLMRHVDQAPDGIDAAERKARLAAIDRDIAELERAEEKAIRALEASGIEFVRRADASPAVLADL